MMLATIHITQGMINQGRKKSCGYCPVALGIQRLLKPDFKALVGKDDLRIYKPLGYDHQVQLPRVVRQFVADYDADKPVQPFSFQRELPAKVLQPK